MTFVASGELASPRLRLDRTLPLSRNEVFDDIKQAGNAQKVTSALLKDARLDEKLAYAAFRTLEGENEDLYEQLKTAYLRATQREADVLALRDTNTMQIVEKHAGPVIRKKSLPQPLLCISRLKPMAEPKSTTSKPKSKSKSKKAPGLPSISEDTYGPAARVDPPVTGNASVTEDASEAQPVAMLEVNPFLTNATKTCHLRAPEEPEIVPDMGHARASLERLILPIFAGEYKKDGEDYLMALCQLKLYLTSAVAFLASLKITGYPVFGLATNGTVGVVLCAWHSNMSKYTYIMDRNVRSFDLTSPIEMYQFATFMTRLREWSDGRLAALVAKHIGTPENLVFQQKTWTKNAQTTKYPELNMKDEMKVTKDKKGKAVTE